MFFTSEVVTKNSATENHLRVMKTTLRILHLEDSAKDAELVLNALQQDDSPVEISVVSTGEQFREALKTRECDVILSDSSISGLAGASALRMAREQWPGIPFIFVSGRKSNEPLTRKPEYAAASDWVSKSDLARLTDAVKNAMSKRRSGTDKADWYPRAVERLVSVVQELSLARNLETIMAIVRHEARELTGADGATFVLREGDLCHYADEEAISPLWKGHRFPMSICISGWAMLNRQAAVIEDIYADDRIPADAYRPTFVKSLAMVPIRTTEPVGAIGTYWATRREPRPEEVRLLQALADSTSIAMENVQLYSGLERTVAERTARLHAVNKELEAFSYSVSHDLRAPVRHIGGFIRLLQDEAKQKLSEKGQRDLGIIADSARQMGAMIDDLLEFSRMGRTDLQQGRVDTNDLVAEVCDELRMITAGREIVWQIDDLPETHGDRAMLKHVWVNLISNAVKYTGKRPRAEIKISANCSDGVIEFSVQDNGAGFDMEYSQKLFGVFQRLHSPNEFEGTGIGLANVQRIVARHGGAVRAHGEVDKGATFYFTLPAK